MGGSAEAPPPPDTSMFSDQATADADQSRQWAQEMWEQGQQQWGQLQEWSKEFMGSAMPAMEETFSWAKESRDRYDQYVMPQMQSLFSEAETYASKEEEDRQRGTAIQDVKAATQAERAAHLRTLDSYGVDPTDTRYAALDKQAGVSEAALSALAANQAGERTKDIGRQLRADAIDVGTGFLNDATQSSMTASNIGAQALGTAGAATTAGAGVAAGANPYMAQSSASNAQGAGIVDQAYNQELAYAEDQRAAAEADAAGWQGIMKGATGILTNGMTGGMGGILKAGLGAASAADGGPVSAPGGPTSDGGAITISDGEYVVPADVVRKLGTNHFDKLIEKETGRPPPSQKQAIPVQGGG